MTFVRFLLIGLSVGIVDLIPGVSGGTLAFAFGIWERIITAITAVSNIIRLLISFQFRASWSAFKLLDWDLLIPLGLGVLLAIFVGGSIIGALLDDHPVYVRAFFLGLFLGVVSLPIRAVRRWNYSLVAIFSVGVIFSFFIAGIPQQASQTPPLAVIFLIGAVTICATILPGLSGSFLLMVFGVYEVFINSIRERDFFVWGSFALGAIVGTLLFSSLIRWILSRHREVVLAALLGLMIGGARVLWPWLGDNRELLPPEDIFITLCWLIGGIFLALLMRLIVIKSEAAEDDRIGEIMTVR